MLHGMKHVVMYVFKLIVNEGALMKQNLYAFQVTNLVAILNKTT